MSLRQITLAITVGSALALALFAGACARSGQYRQDQEYPAADAQSYYNGAKGKSATQRIEQLGQPKKRIVVLNFWNDTPTRSGGPVASDAGSNTSLNGVSGSAGATSGATAGLGDLGRFTADELRRGLYLSQRVIVPADAKTDLATEDFIQDDRIKVAQLIREGRRLGVAVLVIGRITKAVFRQRGDEIGLLRQKQSLAAVDAEIKLFDVSAGREILATSRSGEASSNAMVAFEQESTTSAQYRGELFQLALRNAVALLVPDVLRAIEKMAWQGRIAKVTGTKIYVNAGHASGLVGGDILRVLTPGDDVYDPASGAFLGRSQGQLKGTLEVSDFIGPDGAVTEIHTGGNFAEGDVVQLY